MRKLLNKIANRIFPYHELRYWNKRYEPNAPVIPTDKHIAFVKSHLEAGFTILDFGPGIGRMFPAYQSCRKVMGYDISDRYQSRAIAKAAQLDIPFELVVRKTLETDLPFETDHFDAVVTIGVLLHQHPERIEPMMKELARVGRKVILVSYHEEFPSTPLAPHVFLHAYPDICGKLGFTILHQEHHNDDKQIHLVFTK